MSPSEFSAILTRLTSLKNLSFGVARVGGITDEYLTLLRRVGPATRGFLIAPKLSSLSLIPVGDFASTYTNSSLIDLLEIRWRVPLPDASDTAAISNSPIRSVRLDKGADDGRLDRLRVEGGIICALLQTERVSLCARGDVDKDRNHRGPRSDISHQQ
ncbi:hypothetical protein PM082_018153 [Marasmius tenuissimus]|nr:hypothetical protein PM082_018153 [Marasmius tenuissimus]